MVRLTRAQVREVDRRSIEEYHIPGIVLMENAAKSAAAIAMEMSLDDVLIVCGGGNNGGDGLAMARHLHNAGRNPLIVLAGQKEYTGDALTNLQIARAMRIEDISMYDAESFIKREHTDLVIDALFGTGLTSAPRKDESILIDIINESGLPVLAVDIPSGLNCDTGVPLGPSCVRATRTITFVAEKAGFANPESKQYTGEVIVGDIGCPRQLIDQVHGQTG